MRRTWTVVLGSVIASATVVVVASHNGLPGTAPWRTNAQPARRSVTVGDRQAQGLTFRLSDGAADTARPDRTATPPATPIDDGQAQALLDRLPPLSAADADQQPFAVPDRSLPPPRTGRTIAGTFPPPTAPVEPPVLPGGPLQVLRHAPEGEVPLAPHVSVTFSQPMIALTSHGELASTGVPVTLTPQPSGSWRWIGTQTLLFESTPRLPMATDYQVDVPARTTSVSGGTLAKPERWTFSTPPPALVTSHPVDGRPSPLDPVLFAEFDQTIDPAAVLRTIRVQAGTAAQRLRLATPEEITADERVSRLAKQAQQGRWVAFRAGDRLPPDARVKVTVGPGTPSAEGPNTTATPQAWQFRTFGPLRIVRHQCGWGDHCRPYAPWRVDFSNPLDASLFAEEMVRVEPPLAGMKVDVNGTSVEISGQSRGRTTYRVTFSPRVPDEFGQTLGSAQPLTFNVGSADAWLGAQGGPLVVLDPAGGSRFSVYSVNHAALNVQARAVSPEDWPAFNEATQDRWRTDKPPAYPGRVVLSSLVPVKGGPDEVTETSIDLGPALPGGLGHVILVVEPTKPDSRNRMLPVAVWIQATRVGLDAFADSTDLVAWASALDTGKPLSDVRMSLVGGRGSVATGRDGVARLPLDEQPGSILVARSGQDIAMLPEFANWYRADAGWRRTKAADGLRWYVFDDRRLYRPGEEVKIKGWIRIVGGGKNGDVRPLGTVARQVTYTLRDSRRNEIGKGTAALNAFGGFDTTVTLPATMNLGDAEIAFQADAGSFEHGAYSHALQVQEFRRPEFEVTTRASEGPHVVGGHVAVEVAASYFAGGGLPNADVTWRVISSPGSFTPPNRGDYSFGTWVPWWELPEHAGETWRTETLEATTDSAGTHQLRIDLDGVTPPRPVNLHAEATVMDVNRQAWTSASDLLVHPSTLAVGLKTDRYFVQRGDPLPVDLIVVDLDGRAVPGHTVRMTAERLDWKRERGTWAERAIEPQDCTVTSAAEPSRCSFRTLEGGTYRITATVTDSAGRPNRTQIRRWVAGGTLPPQREVDQERATLIPNKREYRPGETAEVLVITPFVSAEALLTLRRSGIVRTERFTIAGTSHTLKIPIDGAWTPNVHVQIDLVGSTTRTTDAGEPDPRLPARPAYGSGSLDLQVPPVERTLALQVTPRAKAIEPGGETVLDLTIRDAGGTPVAGAEAAVVVVDEAVLSLTGYRLPDPLKVFYSQREEGVSDHHLRGHVLLSRPDRLDITGGAGGGVAESAMAGAMPPPPMPAAMAMQRSRAPQPGASPSPIALRTDFNALALFAASVPTDASGHAEVRVKVPDNLTRYRVMAVAVAGATKFGSGESTLTARLPLMVRASAPRFLNIGDRLELPIVLQNQTDAPMSVDVAMRAANAALTAGQGRRVVVPANDRVEVQFPVAATRPGTARFQIAAASGRWADASEFSLPVWTPATTEAFATYGRIDQGAIAQRVKAPSDAFTEFGGLEITTSSTAVQALTDAVLYLVSYPFECAEQVSSRVLAVAALKDVLTAFGAAGLPDPQTLATRVSADLERLGGLQNDDGGFALWRRGDESWPYVSIHVAHALERARAKGFSVRPQTIERSRGYLKTVEKRIPGWYSAEARQTLIAYALYVRKLMGDTDAVRARQVIQQAGLRKLSFEAVGWLLAVLSGDQASVADVAAIRTYLGNQVTETAATAHFAVSYGDGAYVLFESNRRADAVVLDALITDQPKNDVIPKIVEGLLGHRTAGRWENTQENVFILLALDRYFKTYEQVTPDFVARAWLGNRFAGEQAFKGRTTERHSVNVPMKMLAETTGPSDLMLSKDGPGRLYYRIGLQYAPRDLDVKPLDRGFTVERRYEGVDDPKDVRRDVDGTWHIRAGARVRVRLSMIAPARRYHVALIDPLPAGLEALNPALKTSGQIPPGRPTEVTEIGAPGLGGPRRPGGWWFWTRPWFEHQNLRDERAEAFSSLLWEGVYTYSYVARATTPGHFVVPPPRAEEMYHPETFGRGATDRVIVEAAPR